MVIFLVQICGAVGLAPSRTKIDFQPYLKQSIVMHVINSENREMFVKLYVKGDLKDYIKISETNLKLGPNEIKTFNVDLELPDDIDKPGIHDNRVGAVETSDPSKAAGAMIGAVAGVESQLWIKVPHKDKYIETQLSATNTKVGEDVTFTLTVSNQGIFDLTQVSSNLNVYDFDNNLIKVLKTESRPLNKLASTSFILTMPTDNLKIGKYKVVADIKYDELNKKMETGFKIGDFLIKINKLEIAPIEQGTIGEFLVHLENFWPDMIEEISLELKIKQDNKVLDIVDGGPYSLSGWETKMIPMYWKSGDSDIGDYNAEIVVSYGDKTAKAESLFKVVTRSKAVTESPFSYFVPIALALILIIGFIIYLLFTLTNIKISTK